MYANSYVAFSLNFLARFFETTSSSYHHFSIDSSVSDSYEILHRDLHENVFLEYNL